MAGLLLAEAPHRQHPELQAAPERERRLGILLARHPHEQLARYSLPVTLEVRLHGLRQARERKNVRHVGPTLAEQLRDFAMAVPVPRDEVRQALGFLERREILALQVLDEGELERILYLAHERGQPIEAGELRRPETPLPGHDLEAGRGRPHHDRLQEPVRLDRRRQLAELLVVEVLTWLIGVRVHVPERHDGQHRALPTLHGARDREPPYRCPLALLRSEEHTSELQSPCNLVCRLLLEKKKTYALNVVENVREPATRDIHREVE